MLHIDRSEMKGIYSSKIPIFESLSDELNHEITDILRDNEILTLPITMRIKDFDSFYGKINRKGYKDPFNECEDICGIRIICYYLSDLDKVCSILKNRYDVKSMEEKEQGDPQRFNYRSTHLILNIEQTSTGDDESDNLKAEVQVRTVLMHAWAEIEHELQYKTTIDIPIPLRRRISQLSALLELCDDHFERMRNDRNEYVASLRESEYQEDEFIHNIRNMEKSDGGSIDLLSSVLDRYLPNERKDPDSKKNLMDILSSEEVPISDLAIALCNYSNSIISESKMMLEIPRSQGLIGIISLMEYNDKIRRNYSDAIPDLEPITDEGEYRDGSYGKK